MYVSVAVASGVEPAGARAKVPLLGKGPSAPSPHTPCAVAMPGCDLLPSREGASRTVLREQASLQCRLR